MLRELGYGVLEASNGAEALEMLKRNRDVDLLFTDIVMPGGMNGLDLARAVQSEYPGTPILLTTGFSGAAATADAHGVEIVPKPYDSTKVLMMIAKMIARVDSAASAD